MRVPVGNMVRLRISAVIPFDGFGDSAAIGLHIVDIPGLLFRSALLAALLRGRHLALTFHAHGGRPLCHQLPRREEKCLCVHSQVTADDLLSLRSDWDDAV